MKIVIVFAALTLSGCMSMPTQQEIASADYGAYPSQYQQIVRGYFQATLKDPESAQYASISKPVKYSTRDWGTMRYGYLVCVAINAKNSYGAYTGFDHVGLLIHNDRVVENFKRETWGTTCD